MKIVIIGGVAAGAKAAAKVKRNLPDAEVTIYTQDTNVSYSTCGLPYYIEGAFEDWKRLIVRPKEEFEKAGINVFTQHTHFSFVTGLLEGIPLVGLFAQSNSDNEVMAKKSGSDVKFIDKLKEGTGAILPGVAMGAGIALNNIDRFNFLMR